MIGNLHVLVGTSNGLVSRRERDVTLTSRLRDVNLGTGSRVQTIPRALASSTDAKSLYFPASKTLKYKK